MRGDIGSWRPAVWMIRLAVAAAIVSAVYVPAAAFALRRNPSQAEIVAMQAEAAAEIAAMQAEADRQVALAQRDTAIMVAGIIGGALIVAAVIVGRSRRRE